MKTLKKFIIFFIVLIFILPFFSILFETSTTKNFLEIFSPKKNIDSIFSTINIALLTLLLNFIIGFPAASILFKNNSNLIKIINGILYLPLIIPGMVLSIGLNFSFIKLDLIETNLGVVLIHTLLTIPYFIKSLSSGYKSIDQNYYNLSKFVGASSLETFFNITLPKLLPSIVAGSSLVVIVSFSQYITTLIIGGGRIITLPILIYPYISGGDLKTGGVFSLIFIFVNLILLGFLEKFIKNIYSGGK